MEIKRRTARTLVKRLSSVADDDALAETIAEIRLLSKHDTEIRAPLVDSGAVALLAGHLISGQNNPLSQENAAAALLNLSIDSREALMSTPGLLDALARTLHAPGAAQHAAATIYSLLSVETYRPIIGSKIGLVSALLDLIRSPPSPPTRSVKDALKALFGIALYPLNRPSMVELGAVPALFSLIFKDGRSGVVEDVTAVIAQVAGCYESIEAFRRVAGVPVLVDLVDAGTGASGRTRENAVSALLNLAMYGGQRAVGDIREVEAAEAAVSELAENGSARAKSKSEALLKVLSSGRGSQHHRFADFDPPPSPSPSPCCSSASAETF